MNEQTSVNEVPKLVKIRYRDTLPVELQEATLVKAKAKRASKQEKNLANHFLRKV